MFGCSVPKFVCSLVSTDGSHIQDCYVELSDPVCEYCMLLYLDVLICLHEACLGHHAIAMTFAVRKVLTFQCR